MTFLRNFLAMFVAVALVIGVVIGSIDLAYHIFGPGNTWLIVWTVAWVVLLSAYYAWVVRPRG